MRRALLTVLIGCAISCSGADESAPRRLAVVDFRPYGNQFEWGGQKSSTVEWVKSLSDKLTVRFAKTHAFSVLERKFVAEINDELAGLNDANVDPTEVVRKAKRLVTDFLIVGEVRFYPVAAAVANPLTGQALPAGSGLFAEVSYRVVSAPTGQLRQADIVRIDTGSFSVSGIGDFVSQSTDAAASQIVAGVLSEFRPDLVAAPGVVQSSAVPAGGAPATTIVPPTSVRGNGTGGVVTPF